MSKQTLAALEMFDRAMKDPRNLLELHKKREQRGRRWAETTLNRGMVFLTVAAWEGFVEELARAIVLTMKQQVVGNAATAAHMQVVESRVSGSVGRLNTPNVYNIRKLFGDVAFDPVPHWAWVSGRTNVTPLLAEKWLDEWLDVRHSIAHGAPLPAVSVLSKTPVGLPSLRRKNAEDCIGLFTKAAELTSAAADVQFP